VGDAKFHFLLQNRAFKVGASMPSLSCDILANGILKNAQSLLFLLLQH